MKCKNCEQELGEENLIKMTTRELEIIRYRIKKEIDFRAKKSNENEDDYIFY